MELLTLQVLLSLGKKCLSSSLLDTLIKIPLTCVLDGFLSSPHSPPWQHGSLQGGHSHWPKTWNTPCLPVWIERGCPENHLDPGRHRLRLHVFYFFFFWSRYAACRIVVPQPGIESRPPTTGKAPSPNHWPLRSKAQVKKGGGAENELPTHHTQVPVEVPGQSGLIMNSSLSKEQ